MAVIVNSNSNSDCTSRKRGSGIVSISYPDSLKIHILSFLWGLWCLFKKIMRSAWYSSEIQSKRDNPPACLIDTSLGRHSYVKLKGVKLHYVEAGDKTSPVLLMLHGFPDCWISWRNQIHLLSSHYRVIVLDLKGFGDSDKPESRKCYRLDVILSEITELINSLGVNNCSIIGHDLGALIGWFIVHLHPNLVNKFVAISCPHPNLYWNDLPNSSSFNTSWIYYCQLPHLPELDALRDDLSIINRCYLHLSSKEIFQPYLDAYKYSFSRKEDWTGPINYYRNLPFWRVNVEPDVSVNIPCLLITGNQDTSVKLESIVKSTEYLSAFSVKVIEDAGHFPHQERPHDVNKALITFLIGNKTVKTEKVQPSGGLVTKVFEAVSSTMKYGNQVLNVFQKETYGITANVFYVGQSSTS